MINQLWSSVFPCVTFGVLFSSVQGCTIYKQEDAVFIGKLLKGCDAEQSGMCLVLLHAVRQLGQHAILQQLVFIVANDSIYKV